MSDFRRFASAISKHFAMMSKGELFRVAIEGDALWELYLNSYPNGTNEIYRTRRYYDGSYDRNFVRRLGNVVSISDTGKLVTIWDAPGLEFPFNVVAEVLSNIVKSSPIINLFRIKEQKLGYEQTLEHVPGGSPIEWHHFHAAIAPRHFSAKVDEVCGEARTTAQVMDRGFSEISPEAVNAVLELMDEGTLYKGDEFKEQVKAFQKAQQGYSILMDQVEISKLIWSNLRTPISRLRNTVIGTLLTDLSEGKDLEAAVKSYEQKTAPINYKRPTAPITKSMIEAATVKINDLGLESALERRFAQISDITINNVLWADNSVQPQMKGGIADLLMKEVKVTSAKPVSKHDISIDDFMENILPKAISMEMFFSGTHQPNLMSLTAPVHPNAGSLFKWDNNFAWSYNGNITDSIKEKVKTAGGNIDAKLRVSLAWFNHDDLDLHAQCPDGHVYYAHKGGDYRSNQGNILDVDMNAGMGHTRTPVENLSWVNPKDGQYKIMVHQFRKRESDNVGFVLEVECDGKVTQYSYVKGILDGNMIDCISFNIKQGAMTDLTRTGKGLDERGISQEKWSINTEQFVKINTVLHSPNHWDDNKTGNKHVFFILDGCLNDEPARGIYNEFLKSELETHRKVFEVLGNKTKCPVTTQQLSGLGFSSTKRDSVLVRVTDQNSIKLYNINF